MQVLSFPLLLDVRIRRQRISQAAAIRFPRFQIQSGNPANLELALWRPP